MVKIVKGVLSSRLMQRNLPYRVLLPESHGQSQKSYPALYLLHGLFGGCDNWLDLTDLDRYLLGQDLIVILPEGDDGWYTDGAVNEEDKFESYFLDELIPEIDALYKTINQKEKRAVAGLSMGGYGALKFGCKRPDLFVFAGSLSGAFDAPNQSESNHGIDWENLGPSVKKIFGRENSLTRQENDLYRMIEQIPEENLAQLPQFYIDCGTEDGFLEANRKLAAALRRRNVQVDYYEVPGGHDWVYWNRRLKYILPVIESKFNLAVK